jgi:hypothetical protein
MGARLDALSQADSEPAFLVGLFFFLLGGGGLGGGSLGGWRQEEGTKRKQGEGKARGSRKR